MTRTGGDEEKQREGIRSDRDSATKKKDKLYRELDAESEKLKNSQAEVFGKKIEILELKEALKVKQSALEENEAKLRKAKEGME